MDKPNIKISIITINYNRSTDLDATISSVKNQTYKDYEYVIVDGGSSDNSIDVIKKNDNIIDKWISERDKGIFDAMNKGIKMASGEYLLFLNGGDIFIDENSLNNTMSALNNCIEDIIYGDILVEMPYRGNLLFKYPDKLSFRFFLERDLPHQATFIKRTLFSKIGYYDVENPINADWAFFILAICKFNVSYRHIPIVFTLFQRGGVTNTMTKLMRVKSKEPFLEEHFGMFYRDMLDYVLIRQRSIRYLLYKFLVYIVSGILKLYFSLGGKQYKFFEQLKPGPKNP